ncbi:MAG: EpsG family protein [Treponema sp.]|nr:EpsG family protein [Treponema sp.]
MTSYIIMYLLVVISGFICTFSKKLNSVIGVTLFPCIVLCIFFFSFRDITVGTDTKNYVQNFYTNWSTYNIEALYSFFNRFFYTVFHTHFIFFAFEATIVMICSFILCEKQSYFICFPLLFSLLYLPGLNIQRQVLALSCILVVLFKHCRYSILDFILLIVCCFIHKSGMFFVAIYIFSRFINLTNKTYKILFIGMFFLLYFHLFDKILFLIVNRTPYKDYINFFYEGGKKIENISVLNCIKWVLYFCLFNYTSSIVRKRNLYNSCILLMFVSDILAKQYPFLFRVSFLFSPIIIPCMVLVCRRISLMHKRKDIIFCTVVFAYYTLQFAANLLIGQNDIIPFSFYSI